MDGSVWRACAMKRRVCHDRSVGHAWNRNCKRGWGSWKGECTPVWSCATLLQISFLVASFGKYVNFNVRKGSTQQPLSLGQLNAFQAFKLMTSQAHLGTQTFPPSVAHPRNKKDELYNNIICFFWTENLLWTPSEVDRGVAANAVKTLTDALWYIDGQHEKLSERNCGVPMTFSQFTDYNKPERSNTENEKTYPSRVISLLLIANICLLTYNQGFGINPDGDHSSKKWSFWQEDSRNTVISSKISDKKCSNIIIQKNKSVPLVTQWQYTSLLLDSARHQICRSCLRW